MLKGAKKKINRKKRLSKIGILVLLTLIIANFGLVWVIRLESLSQVCFTREQVATLDSRCLYILNNKIFQRASSRNNPHQGHPCGMDVTSIIPSFHMGDAAKYLDPNYLGIICIQPTSLPTIIPISSVTPTSKSGDANNDLKVDGLDYIVWLGNYNKQIQGIVNGDFNNNGIVDGLDYIIWLNNYNK